MDLLCANCPSAEIFNKYICEKDHSSNIKQYNFRHKKETNEVWDAKSVLLEMKNGEKIVKDIDNDMYLKVYHTCSLPCHLNVWTVNIKAIKDMEI